MEFNVENDDLNDEENVEIENEQSFFFATKYFNVTRYVEVKENNFDDYNAFILNGKDW